MYDLKKIREQPEAYEASLLARNQPPGFTKAILELDEARRHAQTAADDLMAKRNSLSKEVGEARAKGDMAKADGLIATVGDLKTEIAIWQAKESEYDGELKALLARLPNPALPDVPLGKDEAANRVERYWGDPKTLPQGKAAKAHFEIGEALAMMDFSAAAAMSGARFVLLRGHLARLERALANFMLDMHTLEHGYTEYAPPFLVREQAMFGTGQLPKFADDLFQTTDGFWLIPTAEVPLTNSVMGKILDAKELPLRLTAWTPCFRSEAGAAGRDTRGMIRMHQFSKVEMVSITTPLQSEAELARMTGCAEAILQRLELPYRVLTLSTGDMGFSACKTHDLEVWVASQNCYREISSCSNCGDFQARRMGARYKHAGEKGGQFVHTLNGSGLAVGRTLVAVLEAGYQEDGSVKLPAALVPYMGGVSTIWPFRG